MNTNELGDYLRALTEEIIEDSAQIVAYTAAEYYRDSFSRKAFDGNPWVPGRPKASGSLLIASGALANSIHPAIITRQLILISAGNANVPYAQVHNEGYSGPISVGEHRRRMASGKDTTVKAHTRQVRIPQRQFMGESEELNEEIYQRITGYVASKTK